MSVVVCESRVLEASAAGDIVEITFRGKFEWTHGKEISRFIQQTIGNSSPAAVIINLLDYEYHYGKEILSLVEAFRKKGSGSVGPRPGCIVATGVTLQSIYPFFADLRILVAFQLHFVSSVEEASEWLRESGRMTQVGAVNRPD